ncbi:MAG: RNA polymerase sigma factor [bacterium]|nr:RNA polymerase sigma factor [bacterium]
MQSSELIQAGYRYALALTHDRHEAEDLVHDAWLKLHESSRLFKGRGYFLRTVRNLFIDRHRRNRMILLEPLTDATTPVDTGTNPESGTDFASGDASHLSPDFAGAFRPLDISDAALNAALAQIRPEEREALYLNAVEQMSATRIAKHTGRPRSTVLSLIQRGKTKLQRILNHTRRPRDAEGS